MLVPRVIHPVSTRAPWGNGATTKPSCSTSPTLRATIRSCHSCPLFWPKRMAIVRFGSWIVMFLSTNIQKTYQNWGGHCPLPWFWTWLTGMVLWLVLSVLALVNRPCLLRWLVGHILGSCKKKKCLVLVYNLLVAYSQQVPNKTYNSSPGTCTLLSIHVNVSLAQW